MPFEGFEAYLSGFEEVHEDPKSISLLVAVDNNIHLCLYVASHIYPQKCALGKKFVLEIPKGHAVISHQNLLHLGAKGRISSPDCRLFAYGAHTKANGNGLAMLHSG
eukprot:6284180-Ditylum_brightwellii.AAC.1